MNSTQADHQIRQFSKSHIGDRERKEELMSKKRVWFIHRHNRPFVKLLYQPLACFRKLRNCK